MLAILIVNYRTLANTQACIDKLRQDLRDDDIIFLLDNGSGAEEQQALASLVLLSGPKLCLTVSPTNLGFAAGMNLLLRNALADPGVDEILLLNSDTLPTSGFIAAMRAKLDRENQIDMVAARLLQPRDQTIDNLGIALYRSTLASNRKREDEVLLGPTGGCALLTRRVLEDLLATHGEWFDEAFFCYAEDTDLVIRARWLGYRPGYAHDAVVYHEGSLSSGGPENDFVLYHGIRNSLWWLVKDAPSGWLLRSLPWFILLHCGICLRHLRRGRIRVLWRLYRDAIKGVPAMRRKRAIIRKSRRVPAKEFRTWIEPHFYERDYLRRAWRELWKPASTRS